MDTISCFDDLFRAVAGLQGLLQGRQFWLSANYGLSTVRTPAGAIGDVYYPAPPQKGPGRKGRAMPPIERYVGWCLVDKACAELIAEVNGLKADLRERVIALQNEIGGQNGAAVLEAEIARLGASRSARLNQLLGGKGLRMLNLLKVYRQLPLIDGNDIHAIQWSVTRASRAITRLSRAEVLAVLDQRLLRLAPGPAYAAISEARDHVTRCPVAEYARVKQLAPQVKANLIGHDRRQTVHASMPFFVLGDHPPAHNGPMLPSSLDLPQAVSRKRRDDRTIQDSPLIDGLNIYPYVREAS